MTFAMESGVDATPRTAKFLSAEWRHLVMVNYKVDRGLLTPWLPPGLELDAWEGKTLVSVVAFEFLDTRVLGLSVPGHRDFHEVNLRFYVRRRLHGRWRRGVVFVRELVPRRAIAWTARILYGERYRAVRMNGTVWQDGGEQGLPNSRTFIRYWWWTGGSYHALQAECSGEPSPVMQDSQSAFITDHSWGYSVLRGATVEYQVEHPPWRVWDLSYVTVDFKAERLGGGLLSKHLKEPCSALVAEGSPVTVRRGRWVTP